MALVTKKQLSIELTSFFLRFVGFWISTDSRQKLLLDIALTYTISAVLVGAGIVSMDLYYSMNDFYKFAYALTNVMTVLTVLFKLFVFTIEREQLLDLIRYSQEKFWNAEYNEIEAKILKDCENKCVVFVLTFTAFAQATVCSYTITPIIENIGKNETDRVIPFNIWLDLPVTSTPYFEILFVVEILSLYHIGVLYFCFDNLLCIFNVHVHGQFRILCHRLGSVCDARSKDTLDRAGKPNGDERYVCNARDAMKKLGECIRQHESLIEFIDKIEAVYRLTILAQVLIFSALICLVSYQAFLAGGPFLRRIIFVAHSAGTFTQLFMFTLTCHDLYEGSLSVADAVYESGWYLVKTNDASARCLKKNLVMIIMRAQRPCRLTAFGFFPITLDTFMKINSTAVSYLTLLRQGAE